MHAPGLQGMPNNTHISCPANSTPLHLSWARSASSAELMSTNANPREDQKEPSEKLFYSLFPNFQPIILSIILPLLSNSTMQPQQKLIAMTCASKFNPKSAVFLCMNAVCKALQSSSSPFKEGISGHGNLRAMGTDKWATSNLSLDQTASYAISSMLYFLP